MYVFCGYLKFHKRNKRPKGVKHCDVYVLYVKRLVFIQIWWSLIFVFLMNLSIMMMMMMMMYFSNISAISWWPVLVVEETGVPGENHQPWVNCITCGSESSAPFCNLQSRTQTHAVLVIGLYELLGNSTHWATRALNEIIFHVTFQRYERIKSTIVMGYRLT